VRDEARAPVAIDCDCFRMITGEHCFAPCLIAKPSQADFAHHLTHLTHPLPRSLSINSVRTANPARTCPPQADRRPVGARARPQAVAAGQDGEERDAQHGAGRPRAHGGRSKLPLASKSVKQQLILSSNNSPSGVRPAMTTFPMLPTSWVSCSTRLVSSRTSTSIATTNTV
jgi:hypothetical protein